jgi:DNA polymerase III subunit beta
MQEKLNKDIALEIIKRVGYCYGKDGTRPNLNGIMVRPYHDRICAAATDGHRMAVWNDTDSNEDLECVVIHGAVLEYLWKYREELEHVIIESHNHSQYPIRVNLKTEEGKKQRSAEFDLGDIDFPPYRLVIPKHNYQSVFAHTLRFKHDVNTIKKRKHKIIRLFTDQSKLYMVGADDARDPTKVTSRLEVGDAVLHSTHAEEIFNAGFDINYLYECLKSIPQVTITIKFSGPLDPLVIESDDSTHVIMPMRI